MKNRPAVWKVIQFLTSQEYQEGWVKAGGGYSVFPEYNKPEYFPHPTIGKIAQMATTGRRTAPTYPVGWNKVYELMVDAKEHDVILTEEGIWVGKLTLDAFDDLEKRLNASFDNALIEARKEGVNLTRADFIFPGWDPTQNWSPPNKK